MNAVETGSVPESRVDVECLLVILLFTETSDRTWLSVSLRHGASHIVLSERHMFTALQVSDWARLWLPCCQFRC